MARKKTRRGMRYTAAQKRKILATATKGNLTGAEVQKRFGVSPLSFYRWRGPVRRRRNATGSGRGVGNGELRRQVERRVRRILPSIIRREVKAYLDRILG